MSEFEEMKQTIEMEIAAKKTAWVELVNTRGNRWRSAILIWCGEYSHPPSNPYSKQPISDTIIPGVCKQWSGNGLVSYYLGSMLKAAGITKELDTTLITATSNMFSFAASIAFAFLPGRVGRRPLLLWSLALMWIVFAVITACSGVFVETGSKPASYVAVAFIYLYNAAHNLGWTGAMMLYGKPDFYPSDLKNLDKVMLIELW